MSDRPPMRGEFIGLTASDGHRLRAYRSAPEGAPRGALVVLHEIFGCNAHIREVCDGYADRGYLAIAPALFDRAERDVEMDYGPASIERGRALRAAIGWDASVRDVAAAIDAAAAGGPVGVIGYCWGGTLAFLAATRLGGLACAVSYYGGQTTPFARERIRVPMLMHFGEQDPRILPDDIRAQAQGNPDIEMHLYPADHGFNCDHRKEWHRESAAQALARTLEFFDRHLRR
ncbi:MAG: dienelactone hydrolase family protein [Burkholderiales bacterium]